MQKLFDYSGNDDFSRGEPIYPNPKRSNPFLSLGHHVDVYFPSRKRSRISAPFVFDGGAMFEKKQTTIEALPDECLYEIFRRLPGSQEKSSCACVSKQWLMLLSTICQNEICFSPTAQSQAPKEETVPVKSLVSSEIKKGGFISPEVEETEICDDQDLKGNGYLSRCLEGKKATDVRLAAIAIGAASRGGLGKLSIRGSNATRGVTNVGLKAVARGCPTLRVLSLWNLPSIGDEGLMEIAKECHLLEKLDLSQCSALSDKSLIAIANNCPSLSSLTIESCSSIGNESLQAFGRCCPNLKFVSIKNCPFVGDRGIASLFSSASYSLTNVKLQMLNLTDVSLAVIGHYGKALTNLSFLGLQNVTEKGFWVMGNGQGLQKLRSFAVTSCHGVTDLGLAAVGKGCPNLKQFCLRKCAFLSDNGLVSFAKAAGAIESLLLEECHRITQCGIFGLILNSKLKVLSLANCLGIKDSVLRFPLSPCHSLRSLSIRNCPGFGNASLAILGTLCPQLQNVDFSGLNGVTDEGFGPLIQTCEAGLVKVNLSNCMNLTDKVVSAICKLHGGTLEALNLGGCKSITDESLVSVADDCFLLSELDVSKSRITDSGIAALARAIQLNLQILSLSGCSSVSDKSLPSLEKLGETLVGLNIQQCRGISNHAIGLLTDKLWKCNILY